MFTPCQFLLLHLMQHGDVQLYDGVWQNSQILSQQDIFPSSVADCQVARHAEQLSSISNSQFVAVVNVVTCTLRSCALKERAEMDMTQVT